MAAIQKMCTLINQMIQLINIYQRILKMKPIDVNASTCIDFEVESNEIENLKHKKIVGRFYEKKLQ